MEGEMGRRAFAVAAILLGLMAVSFQPTGAQTQPAFVRNGLPGTGHERLRPLVGEWSVEKWTYIAVGTREKPAHSTGIVARKKWIADGRFVEDETEGTMAGASYYRKGFLGYSNIDKKYEWTTVDALNANMMVYSGATRGDAIDMAGVFTDQGVLGDKTIGKRVRMRTEIRIESNDRHVYSLYMTPPGGREILADRMVFTRR